MQGFWTVLMLVFSNIFMTFAWYGHLKLSEMKISTGWPLILVILFSWGIAFFEYCLTVPANRMGFTGNGGPFNLLQLKVIQEVISSCCSYSRGSTSSGTISPLSAALSWLFSSYS